jgi:tetratricopeptide (TPR) repeat protein
VEKPQGRKYFIYILFPDAASVNAAAGALPIAKDPQVISSSISKPMTLAHNALQAQQWVEALNYLKVAGARDQLSAFDRKTIYEFTGFANSRLRRYEAAQAAYEEALPLTLAYSAKDALEISRRILVLTSLTYDSLTAIEVGRNLVEHGVATAQDMAFISRSYLSVEDCKYAIRWADRSIAESDKHGALPDSSLNKLKADCHRAYRTATDGGAPPQTLVTQ